MKHPFGEQGFPRGTGNLKWGSPLIIRQNFSEKLQYNEDNWAAKGCVHPKCVYADPVPVMAEFH